MRPLEGRNVALGVSGSIACYKAVDLASKLVQLGAEVDVMMTPAAREFVAPLTFAAITHRPVAESLFDPRSELLIDHVAIAERADVVIIAPATAQTIAKLALGLADDPIGATVLATAAPVIVCSGDGREHVRQPSDSGERGDAGVEGGHDRGTGGGPAGVGADGQGAAAGDGRAAGVRAAGAGADGRPGGPEGRRERRRDAGGYRPGQVHIEPVERQDGLRDSGGGHRPRAPRR